MCKIRKKANTKKKHKKTRSSNETWTLIPWKMVGVISFKLDVLGHVPCRPLPEISVSSCQYTYSVALQLLGPHHEL